LPVECWLPRSPFETSFLEVDKKYQSLFYAFFIYFDLVRLGLAGLVLKINGKQRQGD
jgi:hypothetical protein